MTISRRRVPCPACEDTEAPLDALGRGHVDIEQFGELLRRESFRRAKGHVAGVVDNDVDAAFLFDDLGNPGRNRCIGGDVELDRLEIDLVLGREAGGSNDLRSVAAFCFAHAGVDGVAGLGERAGSESPEAARGSCDDDDLLAHDPVPRLGAFR
jgi:hypothetical protein